MDWPGNSPDMNPIEHVWYEMKKKIGKCNPQNRCELLVAIENSWREVLDSDFVNNLYDTMPNRIKAIIKARGGVTKY